MSVVGVVKSVVSGDCLIIRGQPRGGPPPEKTVCLSNVKAPRLARRPQPGVENALDSKDEPFAWESREFLRNKIIGKEVFFQLEYKMPNSAREYGAVFIGKDATCPNVTEMLIEHGLVEVKRQSLKQGDAAQERLAQLDDIASARQVGIHSPPTEAAHHVRTISWAVDNPRSFVDQHRQQSIDAVIEHVRDGCTVRAFLLPSFQYVTVMLSGIRTPLYKMEADGNTAPEQFADEARFFVESRLLQRSVKIVLESVNNANFVGSIIHPNGNIAELLLREGFARCVDWSMGVVSNGQAAQLRSAEKQAKDARRRIWTSLPAATSQPTASSSTASQKSFHAKVLEIVNADGLIVKGSQAQGDRFKIFLASVRPPRAVPIQTEDTTQRRGPSRPLYDVPWMFEAREFLRKKLLGKKVHVTIDYVQPPGNGFPEKQCATVKIGDQNVAEALIAKGLASVVRYRADDERRSSAYDSLLTAEERAKKNDAGVHKAPGSAPVHRVTEIAGDGAKAKQFLPFLQRAGRCNAIVEFVASGSRLRVYIPRETCLITILLAGVDCPRAGRILDGVMSDGDSFGDAALEYTRNLCMQKEICVHVEASDRGGNFIGTVFPNPETMSSLAVELVGQGLAKVHPSAEWLQWYNQLLNAELEAKQEKRGLWENYVEPVPTTEELEEAVTAVNGAEAPSTAADDGDDAPAAPKRKTDYFQILITEMGSQLSFYAQKMSDGSAVESLMAQLREEMQSNPPIAGSYTPQKGDMCSAKFALDGEWYRARVEALVKGGKASVFFVDFGNRQLTATTDLARITNSFLQQTSGYAHEYSLAWVDLPPDDELADTRDDLQKLIVDQVLLANIEYTMPGSPRAVTLLHPESKDDIGHSLISSGAACVGTPRGSVRPAARGIVDDYKATEQLARTRHLRIWRYGDFRADDAKEFG